MQRIVLLSSLLWWELGTNSLITGPGEWLLFRRFTSKLSWSWSSLIRWRWNVWWKLTWKWRQNVKIVILTSCTRVVLHPSCKTTFPSSGQVHGNPSRVCKNSMSGLGEIGSSSISGRLLSGSLVNCDEYWAFRASAFSCESLMVTFSVSVQGYCFVQTSVWCKSRLSLDFQWCWYSGCCQCTVIFLSFRTDMPGQTVQTQVYTVCNSLCIFWMHYSKEKPPCSTFRVITANFRVSEILGFLR